MKLTIWVGLGVVVCLLVGGLQSLDDLPTVKSTTKPIPKQPKQAAKPLEPDKKDLMEPILVELGSVENRADARAHRHPHGKKVCSSGCALSDHPTEDLTATEYRKLLIAYTKEKLPDGGPALDSLCYYGTQVSKLLKKDNSKILDQEHLDFLTRELRKTMCYIEFRVITEDGIVRVWMPPTKVPLDVRYVFDMETKEIEQPITTSGTVKRTGLHHIWQRI